jgi:hypothetical protein
MGKPLRIPPISEFAPRTNGVYNNTRYPAVPPKDPDRFNCYVEKDGDHRRIVKRYGKSIVYQLDSNATYGQGMTVYNGLPYAVVTDSVIGGDAFVFPPGAPNSGTDGTAWTNGSTGPWSARAGALLLKLNNGVYLTGGFNNTIAAQDVWYSTDTVTWTLVSGGIPFGNRLTFGGCVFNGAMYLSGGYGLSGTTPLGPQNDVWRSTDGGNWTQIATNCPWQARSGHTMLATTAGLFIMGGTNIAGVNLNDIWFSVDGVSWNQITVNGSMWAGRRLMSSWYINNAIFIGGGQGSSLGFNDTWFSTTGGATWSQITAAAWPVGVNSAGCCVYNNKLWIFGGGTNTAGTTAAIYSSPDGATWTFVGNVPMGANAGIAATVFGTPTTASPQHYQSIWLIGGTNGATFVQTAWYGNLNSVPSSVFRLFPNTGGDRYDFQQFSNGAQLLIKSTQALFVLDQGNVQRVWDAAYPPYTVPGIVVLGDSAYVMDNSGLIWGSPGNNPYHWPPENRIPADYESDPGVAIAKYLTYLVAFGTYTTQFFYDAGVSPGSALLPYLSASIKVGCFSAATVQTFDKTVVWMSQNKEGLRQICKFDGLNAVPISTPAIDKLIAGSNPKFFRSDFITYLEHEFYLLSLDTDSGWLTFVYDLVTNEWFRWGDSYFGQQDGKAFLTGGSATNISNAGQNSYFLDELNGNVYSLGSNSTDYDGDYVFASQTQKFDGGNNTNKFWGPMELIGDRTDAVVNIQFTDDDYNTWSNGRQVVMSTPRPIIYQTGQSRRRALLITSFDSKPLALEEIEFTNIEQGE